MATPPYRPKPGLLDHGISALHAWAGDFLHRSGNELAQPMAFYQDNRPTAPEALAPPKTGKACVLVHGLGCNEGLWTYPAPHAPNDYGAALETELGYSPLYLRYNTGLRISDNGRALDDLLTRYVNEHGGLSELLLVGHSMGGLVIRSACHVGQRHDHAWVGRVRHAVYLGTPHLGAPLEKVTNLTSHVLGQFDTTATRVIRDVLNSRSAGIKDLRYGNLVDDDWLDFDPDALLENKRVPVPWLNTAQHHRIVGVSGPAIGDLVVPQASAAAIKHRDLPGAPGSQLDLAIMKGLDHLALARHPDVYLQIKAWVMGNG